MTLDESAEAEKATESSVLPHEEIPSPLPIFAESCSVLEFAALRLSPVYYGLGVPAGDGTAVVIIPGLLGMDLTLFELHAWLARVGYRPYFSGMGVAADCPNLLVEKLMATIECAYRETGRKVHLIGHSLGGIFARSVAVRMPDRSASARVSALPSADWWRTRWCSQWATSYAAASANGTRTCRKNARQAAAPATSPATCAENGRDR